MEINIHSISNLAVRIDRKVDYIPLLSTVTNIAEIIVKLALSALSEVDHTLYEKLSSNRLIQYIMQKDISDCLLLAIPFLNVFMAYQRNPESRDDTEESPSVSTFEETPPPEPSLDHRINKRGKKLAKVVVRGLEDEDFNRFIELLLDDEEGRAFLKEGIDRKERGDTSPLSFTSLKSESSGEPKRSRTKLKKTKKRSKIGKLKKKVTGPARKFGKEITSSVEAVLQGVLEGTEEGFIQRIDEMLNNEDERNRIKRQIEEKETSLHSE